MNCKPLSHQAAFKKNAKRQVTFSRSNVIPPHRLLKRCDRTASTLSIHKKLRHMHEVLEKIAIGSPKDHHSSTVMSPTTQQEFHEHAQTLQYEPCRFEWGMHEDWTAFPAMSLRLSFF